MDQELEVFIFYFDLIGIVEMYLHDPTVLGRVESFHRAVRSHPLGLGGPWSYIVTLYDNVWARINAGEMIADTKTLQLASVAMKEAQRHGFDNYFGVCTRGTHAFSLSDKTLVSGAELVDLMSQHIDSASEPQLRAGAAEKSSARLSKAPSSPVPHSCVWISEEVADFETLESYIMAGDDFVLLGPTFDLAKLPAARWPFGDKSRFTPIGPK
jgi:hypothetical protein